MLGFVGTASLATSKPTFSSSSSSSSYALTVKSTKLQVPVCRKPIRTSTPTMMAATAQGTGLETIRVDGTYNDTWKMKQVADMIRTGALGVIPTDTSYAYVCALSNRKGITRIYDLKHLSGTRKPMSLMCLDLSMAQQYTLLQNKALFKMMKDALPGPYTFILPSTNEVPRVLLEHKLHKKTWKRREVGIRIPDNEYCLELVRLLGEPLLVSTAVTDEDDVDDEDEIIPVPVPHAFSPSNCAASISETWASQLDFVVDSGPLPLEKSTVINCTVIPYEVIREGKGSIDILDMVD
eukprot:CAMPEP_0184695178 /NCGR_PEP_ID=MMETSP0313-20130426/2900_1 /TAXON_ID=2792 /ORGANISM="Porphyridium aerugineum, Strain SAG 1380-2" /LENGTH=293 /DNA_ID=CAMNT_0027153589 /DNA_START=15 /DNA_END=896 /DNA_ORIENTATION=-